jgi:hypothetical protein
MNQPPCDTCDHNHLINNAFFGRIHYCFKIPKSMGERLTWSYRQCEGKYYKERTRPVYRHGKEVKK